jgi:hypothetical protein
VSPYKNIGTGLTHSDSDTLLGESGESERVPGPDSPVNPGEWYFDGSH